MTVTRPILRYHGGKWKLAPWITSFFPEHKVFTETFGGGASILLRKRRVHTEVYNDLDGEICNVFRVLRDPARARELIRILTLTPYSRQEHQDSYSTDGDPIEQARRTIVRSFMGFGNVGATAYSGFRSGSRLTGASAANDWANLPKAIEPMVERMRGVIIDNRPAIEVMRQYDHKTALHYVDPPYVKSTRNIHSASNSVYRHEMSDDEHRELAGALLSLKGMVIVSGYESELYAEMFAGWHRVSRAARADSGAARLEVLWISPNAIMRPQMLFEVQS